MPVGHCGRETVKGRQQVKGASARKLTCGHLGLSPWGTEENMHPPVLIQGCFYGCYFSIMSFQYCMGEIWGQR